MTTSQSAARSSSRSTSRSASNENTETLSRTRTPPRQRTQSASLPRSETEPKTVTPSHRPTLSDTRTITPPPTKTRTRTRTATRTTTPSRSASRSLNGTITPSRSGPTHSKSPTRRSVSPSDTNSSSIGTQSYSTEITISLSDTASRVLTPWPSRSPSHRTGSRSASVRGLTDSPTEAHTHTLMPSNTWTEFVDQPMLETSDGEAEMTLSFVTLSTIGTAVSWLTLSRGEWAVAQSATAGRGFSAMAVTFAPLPPGSTTCADGCRVVGFSPSSVPLIGQPLACNSTHLSLGFSMAPGKTLSKRGSVEGVVALSLSCLVRQPSRGNNISAPFKLVDDRPATPVTVPQAVVDTTKTVAAVASVASVANPALASQAGRMSLLLSLPFCEGGYNPPAISDSPTQLTIGDPDADSSPEVGAVVGNVLVLAACAALQLLCAAAWWYYRQGTRRPKHWSHCVADVRFPGMLIVPVLMLLQYTSGGVVVALAYADGAFGTVLIGVLGLLIVLSIPASIALLLFRFRHFQFRPAVHRALAAASTTAADKPDPTLPEEKQKETLAARQRLYEVAIAFNTFIHGTGKWVSTAEMKQAGVPFARYFGLIVTDYRQATFWYTLVEVITNIVLGFVSTIDISELPVCRAVAMITAVVFVAYALLLAIGRPYHAAFNNVVLIPCAVAQAVGAVLITSYVYTDGTSQWDWMVSLGSLLPTIVTYVMMAKTVVDLILMALEGGVRIYQFLTKKKSSWMAFLDTTNLRSDEFDDQDSSNPASAASIVIVDPGLPIVEGAAALELLGVRSLDVPEVTFTDDGHFVGPTETPTVAFDAERDRWLVKPRATLGFQFQLGSGSTELDNDPFSTAALDQFLSVSRPNVAANTVDSDDDLDDDDAELDAEAARLAHEAHQKERERLRAMLGGRRVDDVERELIGPPKIVSQFEADALDRDRAMRRGAATTRPPRRRAGPSDFDSL